MMSSFFKNNIMHDNFSFHKILWISMHELELLLGIHL